MTAHRTPSDPAHADLPVLIIDDHEPTVRTQIRAIVTELEVSSQLAAVELFRRTSSS